MLKEHAEHFYLNDGCNCAEALLLAANAEYDLGLPDEAAKLMGGYGGGIGCGSACGALLGAVAAYGVLRMDRRAHETPDFKEQCARLAGDFRRRLGELDCGALKERYATGQQRCLTVVLAACDALESLLAETKGA